jgi:hypothetical protein
VLAAPRSGVLAPIVLGRCDFVPAAQCLGQLGPVGSTAT